MKRRILFIALAFLPSLGCHLAQQAAHNLVNEPVEYLDQQKLRSDLRQEAKKLVRDLKRQEGRENIGEDFEDGFIDGYADYMEHGGAVIPPAIPPNKYRRSRFLNPAGHARIQEYFAGFHQGATAAACTGERQYLTVPVLVTDAAPEGPVNVRRRPPGDCPTPDGRPAPPTEVLPNPRPVDPGTGLPKLDRPAVDPLGTPKLPLPKPEPGPKPEAPPKDEKLPTSIPLPTIPKLNAPPDGPTPAVPPINAAPSTAPKIQVPPIRTTQSSAIPSAEMVPDKADSAEANGVKPQPIERYIVPPQPDIRR